MESKNIKHSYIKVTKTRIKTRTRTKNSIRTGTKADITVLTKELLTKDLKEQK